MNDMAVLVSWQKIMIYAAVDKNAKHWHFLIQSYGSVCRQGLVIGQVVACSEFWPLFIENSI